MHLWFGANFQFMWSHTRTPAYTLRMVGMNHIGVILDTRPSQKKYVIYPKPLAWWFNIQRETPNWQFIWERELSEAVITAIAQKYSMCVCAFCIIIDIIGTESRNICQFSSSPAYGRRVFYSYNFCARRPSVMVFVRSNQRCCQTIWQSDNRRCYYNPGKRIITPA